MPKYSLNGTNKPLVTLVGTIEVPGQRQVDALTLQTKSEQEAAPVEEAATVQEQAQEVEIQRQCFECQGEEKDSDEMPSLRVQAKLTVGAPDDKYEQEADRVALQVMAMPDSATKPQSIQRQSQEDETLHKQSLADSITSVVQRSEDEEDVQTKPSVQRAVNSGANDADSSLESRLSAAKGGGSPLTSEVRAFMEPRFGTDFSAVRIHTGSTAVQMNKELHAQAFTHGSDVYFNEGKYNPGSNEGKQLLAHELTHVVQQTGAKQLQRKPLTKERSNKETLQAKISPASGAAIQLKESPGSAQEKKGKGNKEEPQETPKSLVEPSPVAVQRPDPDLAKEIAQTHSGTVLYHKAGDPKQVTQNLLTQHRDAFVRRGKWHLNPATFERGSSCPGKIAACRCCRGCKTNWCV